MSLARSLAWNTGVQVAGKMVSTAIGIVIIGILTRYLGQTGFGAYSTANAYLQIFALVLDLGLNVTFVAMLGEHAGDKTYERRAVSAIFTLRLLMAVPIIGLIAPAIAWLTPYPPLIKLAIAGLAGSFIFPSLNQVVSGVQQAHLKMHIAAIGEILGRMVLLIGLLYARAVGLSLLPIVLFVSLGSFANFFWCVLWTSSFASFRLNWDPAFWLATLKRTWPVGVSIAFNLIYFKADTLILSLTRSQAEVGIYSAAYRVLEILVTIPFMYAGVLLPILSATWARKNHARFAELLARSIALMWLLILPMIVGTLLFGPRILALVAGPAFMGSGDVLRILIVAIAAIYLNVIFAHAVVAMDAQRKMIPVYITVALVTLAGYLLFIPTYGMWAAAWLTVFSEIGIGIGSLLVTKKFATVTFSWRTPVIAIGASTLMGMVLYTIRSLPVLVIIPIGAIVYLGLVLLVAEEPIISSLTLP